MSNRILNITNGDYFNDHFVSNFGGEAVPFREVMMDGDSVPDIYSDEFIALRSAELNVTCDEYRKNMVVYDALCGNEYSELALWFGKDTFCQMNLLTLLAYLEQLSFQGRVVLNYIDDESFEVIEPEIYVELGIYRKLYESVLVNKQMPDDMGVIVPKAVELYFDYRSDEGTLACAVRDNLAKGHMGLLCLLLEISAEYGLSDTQAEKLIEKYIADDKND